MEPVNIETLCENFPGRMNAKEIIHDLKKCFNPENEIVKGPELQQILVFYAEQTIEPAGWQALWVPDSKTSPLLKARLKSPKIVEVCLKDFCYCNFFMLIKFVCIFQVSHVDYQSLEATVELDVNCQEETESETVLLTELHPLKHQENNAVNIEATHNAIQRIRFFYNHLLLPWDSDIQENWLEVHLPVRINMYFFVKFAFHFYESYIFIVHLGFVS